MEKIVVVGGGILGTMHALAAVRRGVSVTHLEAAPEPQEATVRNFGFVHVSARAPGEELEAALRSRMIWEELGTTVPLLGYRPAGSIVVLTDPRELLLCEQALARDDAPARGLTLLDADQVRALNPSVRGEIIGGLHSSVDALVEPRQVLPALREWLGTTGAYDYRPSTTVAGVEASDAVDEHGKRYGADHIIVCPGVSTAGFSAVALADLPQDRVFLEMFQTDPFPEQLTTAVMAADVMFDYPGFALPGRDDLPPRSEIGEQLESHLIVTQRAGGELTIGDTHHVGPRLPFDIDESPIDELRSSVERLLGAALPPVRRRWSGVYGRARDDRLCLRRRLGEHVTVVTGVGGRGMTISPAVAEDTLDSLLGSGGR